MFGFIVATLGGEIADCVEFCGETRQRRKAGRTSPLPPHAAGKVRALFGAINNLAGRWPLLAAVVGEGPQRAGGAEISRRDTQLRDISAGRRGSKDCGENAIKV